MLLGSAIGGFIVGLPLLALGLMLWTTTSKYLFKGLDLARKHLGVGIGLENIAEVDIGYYIKAKSPILRERSEHFGINAESFLNAFLRGAIPAYGKKEKFPGLKDAQNDAFEVVEGEFTFKKDNVLADLYKIINKDGLNSNEEIERIIRDRMFGYISWKALNADGVEVISENQKLKKEQERMIGLFREAITEFFKTVPKTMDPESLKKKEEFENDRDALCQFLKSDDFLERFVEDDAKNRIKAFANNVIKTLHHPGESKEVKTDFNKTLEDDKIPKDIINFNYVQSFCNKYKDTTIAWHGKKLEDEDFEKLSKYVKGYISKKSMAYQDYGVENFVDTTFNNMGRFLKYFTIGAGLGSIVGAVFAIGFMPQVCSFYGITGATLASAPWLPGLLTVGLGAIVAGTLMVLSAYLNSRDKSDLPKPTLHELYKQQSKEIDPLNALMHK